MEKEYLSDIRTLLLTQRAAQIREQIQFANGDGDIEVRTSEDGAEIRSLTWERALTLVAEEMRTNSFVIEQALAP
jgi:hypothetical protein